MSQRHRHPPAPGHSHHNTTWWIKQHFGWLRVINFVLWLLPALGLALGAARGTLGINPLERLLQTTGHWALIALLVSLAVTPLRRLSAWAARRWQARYGKRLSDWNWLVRLRRQFGLYAFFYATLHLGCYAAFDAALDWRAMWDDLREHAFMAPGLLAFAALLPLAATSTQAAMRALGRHWRTLHRLSYAAVALAFLHFWWQLKLGDPTAWPFTLAGAVVLAARALAWWLGDRGPAQEVPERRPGDASPDRRAPVSARSARS